MLYVGGAHNGHKPEFQQSVRRGSKPSTRRITVEVPPRRRAAPPTMAPAAEGQPTSLAQLDPDVLYSPEELAEPAAALVAQMSLEEDASLH